MRLSKPNPTFGEPPNRSGRRISRPLRPFWAVLFGVSRRAALFGAGGAAAFRVPGIASHHIIPAAWLVFPGTTAGLSIGGRGGRCVFAVAAIRDCISILAVCVAASHVSDIFAVAAGLRLMIRPGLIAMVF